MTTASEIITLAYREANFKNTIGAPTTEEFTEGLTLLQSIVDSLFGLVVGTKMTPWYVPRPQRTSSVAANYPAAAGDSGPTTTSGINHPPSNVRLMVRATSETTIFFQYQPEDGAVVEYVDAGQEEDVILDANGALFGLTGSVEQIVVAAQYPAGRNAPRKWIFRADYAAWLEVTGLALTSEIPFPTMFNDYFVTALAIRLSPRFGADPRPVTLLRFKEMTGFIRLQYLQSKEQIVGNAGVPTAQTYSAGSGGRFEDGGF